MVETDCLNSHAAFQYQKEAVRALGRCLIAIAVTMLINTTEYFDVKAVHKDRLVRIQQHQQQTQRKLQLNWQGQTTGLPDDQLFRVEMKRVEARDAKSTENSPKGYIGASKGYSVIKS